MSGGHWDYAQYGLTRVAHDLGDLEASPDVARRARLTAALVQGAIGLVTRFDRLLSGDASEATFLLRWDAQWQDLMAALQEGAADLGQGHGHGHDSEGGPA